MTEAPLQEMMEGTENGQESKGKLFVGGLSWETTSENLRAYMARYGEVVDCSVKMDIATGRSRGFGFVTFRTAEEAETVLQSRPHMLDGKLIDPKKAVGITKTGVPVTKKIFVGGVRSETSDDLLRDYFSQFGTVHSLDFPIDHASNKRRGFCFLEFEEPEAAEKAMEKNFHSVANQTVEVKPAYTKEQQQAMQARGMWPPPSTNKPDASQLALASLFNQANPMNGCMNDSDGQDMSQIGAAAAFYQTYVQYLMALGAATMSNTSAATVGLSTQPSAPQSQKLDSSQNKSNHSAQEDKIEVAPNPPKQRSPERLKKNARDSPRSRSASRRRSTSRRRISPRKSYREEKVRDRRNSPYSRKRRRRSNSFKASRSYRR